MSRSDQYSPFFSCYCNTGRGVGKGYKRIANHRDRMMTRTALNSGFDPDEYFLPHKRDSLDPYDSHMDGMGYSSYYDALDEEATEQDEFWLRGYGTKWGSHGLSAWKRRMKK